MQLVLAAGIALLGGLASGAIEAIVLRQVAIPSAAVAAAYAAAAALLQAVVCVPAGLVAWGACLALARRGGEEERRRRALAATLVTSVLVPIGLLSLRSVHMALLPHTPVLSPQGLAATLFVGLAFLALAVGLTILLGRMLRGGYRQLAVGGYAGAAVSIAMIAFGSSGHGSAPATARAANVLLISIDSLRADVFYEYVEKYASRPLEDFVSGGRLYRNGHTSFSHSLPSHTSMMTGLYPPEHGAQFFYHGLGSPLKEDVETLAERFSAAGFETAGFLNNAWLGPPYGNQAGFGTFVNYGEALQLEPFDPEF
nr:sulfatase-like hydrolase/transferase [Myxococcota bacterium]